MGVSEMLLVMVVAFIILGPQKLLEISRSLGKAVREYKKAMNEIDEDVVEAVSYTHLTLPTICSV